jgi:MinD-like ATPase involved in chromosome partitioning or flagellar assembly
LIASDIAGTYEILAISIKGGVGKTRTVAGVGTVFGQYRTEPVIAIDANPTYGTLGVVVDPSAPASLRDWLEDGQLHTYPMARRHTGKNRQGLEVPAGNQDVTHPLSVDADMFTTALARARRHTSQSTSRLEILASERDPATSEAFSEADYRGVVRVLQRFYNIILTDCGTGLVHSAMAGVLDEADVILIVASPAVDSACSALATLDWLDRQGYSHLVPGATVVVSASRPVELGLDMNQLARHFLPRVRALHIIPFDDDLAEGSEVELDLLSRQTQHAFLELAATVADSFSSIRAAARY